MNIKCFVVIPNHRIFCWLRRFTYSADKQCSSSGHGHDAMFSIEDRDITYAEGGYISNIEPDRTDSRFPTKCSCGYEFQQEDEWQIHTEQQYIREDKTTDEIWSIRKLPSGALYDADWLHDTNMRGLDGKAIHCVLPDGHVWNIDGRVNNCTLPDDYEHKCWCRHGEWPNLTVDKNGSTCTAGAGSIATGKYHGHLINGELISC